MMEFRKARETATGWTTGVQVIIDPYAVMALEEHPGGTVTKLLLAGGVEYLVFGSWEEVTDRYLMAMAEADDKPSGSDGDSSDDNPFSEN